MLSERCLYHWLYIIYFYAHGVKIFQRSRVVWAICLGRSWTTIIIFRMEHQPSSTGGEATFSKFAVIIFGAVLVVAEVHSIFVRRAWVADEIRIRYHATRRIGVEHEIVLTRPQRDGSVFTMQEFVALVRMRIVSIWRVRSALGHVI